MSHLTTHIALEDVPKRATSERLRRVIEWLDHAIEVGASGIALGPIFDSRTHGYDTTDHYRIDPRLGDDGDFDALVAEAHRRGLRVLLDGVFNHVGTDYPRYREAVAGGDTAWFRHAGNDFQTFEGQLAAPACGVGHVDWGQWTSGYQARSGISR